MEQHTCANCNNIFTGEYCNICGQKEAHRYTVAHVFHELLHVFTHADKGIIPFVWNIIRKPGIIALDFVEGRRKSHFNLFQYLLLILSVATFLVFKTDFLEETLKNVSNTGGVKISQKQLELQSKTFELIKKYFNVVQFLFIPIYALFTWLFLGRKKYNYAETMVLQIAVGAQTNTLSALLMLFFLLVPSIGVIIYGVASFVLLLFGFSISLKQFYKISWIKAILYSTLVFICSYIIQILLVAVFTIGYFIVK